MSIPLKLVYIAAGFLALSASLTERVKTLVARRRIAGAGESTRSCLAKGMLWQPVGRFITDYGDTALRLERWRVRREIITRSIEP